MLPDDWLPRTQGLLDMRFLKLKLPMWVAAGLVTSTVVGAEANNTVAS